MKLFNQFNVIPKYLTAFNYAGLNLNETPSELEKCIPELKTSGIENVETIPLRKIV